MMTAVPLGLRLVFVAILLAFPVPADLIVGRRKYLGVPANFGSDPGQNGLPGLIVKQTTDEFGCTAINPPEEIVAPWFALIKRGKCTYEVKARNVQKMRGAVAAIVINDRPGAPVVMHADGDPAISIVVIMIELESGLTIIDEIEASNGTLMGTLISGVIPWEPFFLPCIVIVTVTLCVSMAVLFYKHRQGLASRQRNRSPPPTLSKAELRRLKVQGFNGKVVGTDGIRTCLICLQELEEGEKIRVLPCGHYFHKKCVDQWLREQSRVCPLCKRDAITPDEPTERTALLRRSPSEVEAAAARFHDDEGGEDSEERSQGDSSSNFSDHEAAEGAGGSVEGEPTSG